MSNYVPEGGWSAVASSADGSKLVAGMNAGVIYTSTNSGATWVMNNVLDTAWTSLASSADGSRLIGTAMDIGSGSGVYTSQSIPSPRLNLTSSGGNLTASWLIPSTNFVLQQSPDLNSWGDMTNTPVLNLTNLQDEVALPLDNGSGFFRLKTP